MNSPPWILSSTHTAQEWDNRTLVGNMGWENDVSIARSFSQELRYHWYKYISLSLKARLYSQILKWWRFCWLLAKKIRWFFKYSDDPFVRPTRLRFLHSWADYEWLWKHWHAKNKIQKTPSFALIRKSIRPYIQGDSSWNSGSSKSGPRNGSKFYTSFLRKRSFGGGLYLVQKDDLSKLWSRLDLLCGKTTKSVWKGI